MTERLLIALALIAIVAIAGRAIRFVVGQRSLWLASAVSVAPSESARLLLFSSKWCSDCITQKDVIARSQSTWPRPVEISYHDAVTEVDLARQFGIVMVPALVLARADGRVVDVKQGLVSEDRLRSLIEAAA